MNFFDCVNNYHFENYFYLDGLSDRLGYKRVELLNKHTVQIANPANPSRWMTVAKLVSMLTLIIPIVILIEKILFRLTHTLELPKKILAHSERIKVGTYNILFPQRLDNQGKPAPFSTNIGFSKDPVTGKIYENSAFRTPILSKNLKNADLDIVCFQEITDQMGNDLKKNLTDYEFKWIKHNNFHGVGICYKKERFTSLFEKVLKVDIPIENSSNPGQYQLNSRVHLLLDLQDKTTHKVFRVMSNHMFDPRSMKNKDEQTEKVIQFAESNCKTIDRIIIAGDMNQDQFGDFNNRAKGLAPSETHATSFQPFLKRGYQVDGNYDSTEFTKQLPDNGPLIDKNRCIDWIWVKDFKPEHLPLPKSFDNRGSDHILAASIIC